MEQIRISFCGDTFLKTKKSSNDPFALIQGEFSRSNIIFLNLETVVCAETMRLNKEIKHVSLLAHPDRLSSIKALGGSETLHIVNLAQNHILDFGTQGLNATIEHLEEKGLEYVGLKSKPGVVLTVKGKKLLFLAGYNRYKIFEKNSNIVADEKDVAREITRRRDMVDGVIVSMHWGTEHVLFANPTQQRLARKFVTLGADFIVGHHSHCIQGQESYLGKKIYYSLGNFNFWGLGKKNLMKNRKNIIVESAIDENGRISHREKPIFINENYQPTINHSLGILEKLNEISLYLQPRINTLLFYRIAARAYLRGNLISRLFIIRKKPSKILNTLLWICCKPFNWFCYIGIVVNLLAGDKSHLNDWEE